MNILILGDSSDIFVKKYCSYVLTKEDHVCILSYTNAGKFSELYREMGIKEIYIMPEFEKYPLRIMKIIPLYKKVKEIKKSLPFDTSIDAIHVHYVHPTLLIYFFVFWVMSRKRILTFLGSDILRASNIRKKMLVPFLYSASSIVFMISKQYEFFCDTYGNKFEKKVRIIDFGNELLDIIDLLRSEYSKIECKQEFGLAVDKVTIHVGYNKSKEQQHKKIIEQICLLSKQMLKKVQIVIPWGYGEETVSGILYYEEIKDFLDMNGIDYVFATDFLTGEKLAKFRMSCDIFAYAQTTDAMSDSTLEYVYSGSLFLCPEWLWDNYSLINYETKQCIRYEGFDDLYNVVCEILNNMDIHFSNRIENEMQKIIYKNKSWKRLAPRWRECYE